MKTKENENMLSQEHKKKTVKFDFFNSKVTCQNCQKKKMYMNMHKKMTELNKQINMQELLNHNLQKSQQYLSTKKRI